MDNLFSTIEDICQECLTGNISTDEAVEEIREVINDTGNFDTFLAGFIMSNIGELLDEYSENID